MTIMDFAKVGLPHIVKRTSPNDDVAIVHRTKKGLVQISLEKDDGKSRFWVDPASLEFIKP
jgi:hypothetical protein